MTQPISVISIWHMPIMPMLQQQHIIPFIIIQTLIMPPCVIMQRFFIISAEVLSSQVQVIFIPPGHFSILMVQRGAIIMFGIIALIIGMFIMPFMPPGIIIPVIRSDVILFIVLIMANSFFRRRPVFDLGPFGALELERPTPAALEKIR
jgi:hypothetical protein